MMSISSPGKSVSKIILALCALSIASLLATSNTTDAQSFSCARAQIPSEYAICNNEQLIVLDEQVASLFADKRVTARSAIRVKEISEDQSDWLRQRNGCAQNFDCLEQQYKRRIQKLSSS